MHEQLPSVTYPATDIACNIFITITVARSRNQFYFVQRVSQRPDEFLLSAHVTVVVKLQLRNIAHCH